MKRFRTILFWTHLLAGVVAGVIVVVMSATGAALALEPQLVRWAERDSSAVAVPDGAQALPIDELLRRVGEARPSTPVSMVQIAAEPSTAVRVGLGRGEVVHVDPYTGAVKASSGGGMVRAMGVLIAWHRYLGTEGEGREVGRAITGAANAAFFFLAVSGIYLWWPRRWSWKAVRAVAWFRRGLNGKARDFNWHNTIGLWTLPVLLVVTFSGMMISYRPVGALIYRVFGETPPAPGAPAGPRVPPPAAGARPVPLETMMAAARTRVPDWSTLTLRMQGGRGGGGGGAGARGPQPVTISVKAPSAGPRFSSLQLAFDPFRGQLLREEGYGGYGPGRRARTWLRFLHTGEALGLFGQIVAGMSSLGALVLVYTGLAMALRRLRNRASARTVSAPAPVDRGPAPA